MKRLFAHEGFRRLMIGQSVSSLGDWLGTVALIALALDLTDSSTAVGAILVLRLAPSLVAGPLVTRFVRRWNRRRTMLAMDAARVGIVLLIPLVAALWWLYIWAFVLEAAGLVFLPARDAGIPDLVDSDELPLANGLVLASSYATIPLGAALFGLVGIFAAGRFGTTVTFALDAATFAVSFVMIRTVSGLDVAGDEARLQSASFFAAFRIPIVRVFSPVTVIATLGLGALFSVGIVFVREVLHASSAQFGVLIALFGVGAAGGLAALHLLAPSSIRVVRWALAAQGAVIATMSLSPSIGFVFLGAALFGAATSATLTSAMSALQELVPDRERVMAFAAFHTLIRVGLSLSAIAAGVATDLVRGVQWPVVGHLPPARVVLLGAGLVVVLGASIVASMLRGDVVAPPAADPTVAPPAAPPGRDAPDAPGPPEPHDAPALPLSPPAAARRGRGAAGSTTSRADLPSPQHCPPGA